MMRRFAYLNLNVEYSSGICKKLEEQAEAVLRQNLDMDVIWLPRSTEVSAGNRGSLIVRGLGGKSRLACRVRQMRELRKLRTQYRGILVRYPLCDPVTFAYLRGANLASEHHTKEIPELRACRDPRLISETILGRQYLQRFAALFAVTDEILEYEQRRIGVKRPGFVIYNGISAGRFPSISRFADLFQKPEELRLVVASPTFPNWHGLDLVLRRLKRWEGQFVLHVCGVLPGELECLARDTRGVILHGHLGFKDLLDIYSQSDIGIASFALHRKDLVQATSLKVREYLACGLPVVMGHHDPAFAEDFPYVLRQQAFDLDQVRDWCTRIKPVTREEVFKASEVVISVDTVVKKQVQFLDSVFSSSLGNERRR